jgi:hypothetical protein
MPLNRVRLAGQRLTATLWGKQLLQKQAPQGQAE